jgi:hypothetical protein
VLRRHDLGERVVPFFDAGDGDNGCSTTPF